MLTKTGERETLKIVRMQPDVASVEVSEEGPQK